MEKLNFNKAAVSKATKATKKTNEPSFFDKMMSDYLEYKNQFLAKKILVRINEKTAEDLNEINYSTWDFKDFCDVKFDSGTIVNIVYKMYDEIQVKVEKN